MGRTGVAGSRAGPCRYRPGAQDLARPRSPVRSGQGVTTAGSQVTPVTV